MELADGSGSTACDWPSTRTTRWLVPYEAIEPTMGTWRILKPVSLTEIAQTSLVLRSTNSEPLNWLVT